MEHQPVLVREVLEFLAVPGIRLLLDATVGAGGHARSFLDQVPEGRVIGIDRDAEILDAAKEQLAGHAGRFELRHEAFSHLGRALELLGSICLKAGSFAVAIMKDVKTKYLEAPKQQ